MVHDPKLRNTFDLQALLDQEEGGPLALFKQSGTCENPVDCPEYRALKL